MEKALESRAEASVDAAGQESAVNAEQFSDGETAGETPGQGQEKEPEAVQQAEPAVAGKEGKVDLNQLEQIAAKQREEAQEEAEVKAEEESHSDVESVSNAPKSKELTEEEVQELSTLDRQGVVERLEALYAARELEESKNMVALLRIKYKERTGVEKKAALDKFLEGGGNKAEFRFSDALEERFQAVSQKIRDYHQQKREELERLMEENLRKKQALLEELKRLIEDEKPLKQTYDEFNKLTETWREIKPIARPQSNNLWQSYHFLVEKFFEKVRINNELRDLDYKKNLEEKLQLCEKAESLLMEESISKASRALHDLHDRWKEIGPVALEKKDEIWERFKAASDAIAGKRKEYYEKLQAGMEQNLLAKKALCEKAEALLAESRQSFKQWNEATSQVEELMKLWKSIGRAPQSDNDAIWERFRGSLNVFFETKNEFFRKKRDEQNNNYNLKVDLCVQAENIARQREDFKAATADLLKLQQQWREIGPVPYRLSDKIWKRFRAACDEFFKRKADFYEGMRSQEGANKQAKEALVEEARQIVVEGKESLMAAVKDLQRRWTEIGHVPIKDKDRLYAEFRAAIDEKFKALGPKAPSRAVRDFAGIQTEEDAARMSGREVSSLQNRISLLRNDINLWENNMGFISQSKSSDVLRREFERKIERAKQDLALLEAKLKLVRAGKDSASGKKPAQDAATGQEGMTAPAAPAAGEETSGAAVSAASPETAAPATEAPSGPSQEAASADVEPEKGNLA